MRMMLLSSRLTLVLWTACALCMPVMAPPQKPMKIEELVKKQKYLDKSIVALTGILVSGHVGVFLKDEKEKFAVRIRFEKLPEWASSYAQQKDDLYRKFKDAAGLSLDNMPQKYRVELKCLVSVLGKKTYDIYTESPLQIYPIKIFRVDTMNASVEPK
jgi:hypothetical protein